MSRSEENQAIFHALSGRKINFYYISICYAQNNNGMVDINFLDKLLNYLRENDGIGLSDTFDTDFTKEENKYLRQAAERLENDGYAQSIGKYQFFITFDGLIALDETFLGKYKNQPYKRIRIRSRWNNAWLAIKVVVTVIHGVALLILAALAIDEIRRGCPKRTAFFMRLIFRSIRKSLNLPYTVLSMGRKVGFRLKEPVCKLVLEMRRLFLSERRPPLRAS